MFRGYFGLVMLAIVLYLVLGKGRETVSIIQALGTNALQGVRALQGR